MKKLLVVCLALSLVIGFAACSKKEQAKPTTPKAPESKSAPAPTPAPKTSSAPTPAPAPATTPAAATAPAAGGDLKGSKWTLGDFTLTFTDDAKVNIKGGPLATLPNGLDAPYTFKDGKVEVSAAGQTKTGTFDGNTLVIDGKTAVRAQ